MIKFTRLRAENFLSFEKIDVDLDGGGLIRVNGENRDSTAAESNDAGKSNLFNAITWALFEKLAKRGDSKVADEVVHKRGKNCIVTLNWTIGDEEYEVTRCRKHDTYGNSVFISSDTSGYSSAGKRKATNEEIVKALGLTYDMFVRSVFWAQGRNVRRLTQLTDSEYKALFDELIDTEHYAEKLAKVRTELSECSGAIASNGLDGQVLLASIAAKEDELASISGSSIENAKEVIPKINAFNKCRQNHSLLSREYQKATDSYDSLKTRYDFLDGEIDRLGELVLQAAKGVKTNTCSQCGQSLATTDSVRRAKEYSQKIQDTTKERKRDYDSVKIKMDEASKAKDNLWGEFEKVGEHLEALRSEINDMLPDEWRDRFDDILVDLAASEKNSKRAKEVGAALTKLRKEYEANSKESDRLVSKQNKLKILEHAYGPSGMRCLRLSELSPFLNESAAHYSDLISDGYLKVEFTTATKLKSGEIREKYKITVSVKTDIDFDLSGGGMIRRADLIAAMALESLRSKMTGKTLNLKVFDEAGDGLDAIGESCLVSVLRDECQGTTFFVSHKALVSDNLFDSIWTVVKSDGVSRIEA